MEQGWSLESAASRKGPLLHPLAGARLRVFLKHALFTPGFDSRSRLQRFIAWCAQAIRILPTVVEKVRFNVQIRKSHPQKPPVFIIGHWRSGTTHLHNLMSRDSQFGYLKFSETAMPLNMLGREVQVARLAIDAVLPETRGYDNVRLSLDEPQEEEMALGNLCSIGYYGSYYFPMDAAKNSERALFFEGASTSEIEAFRKSYDFLIRKLNLVKGGRQLLFKNPPSTSRMPLILEMFPDAKFIHIVRNPWPVFSSNCKKFPRLFNAFAWQPFQDFDVSGNTLNTYEKLMRRYLADREKLGLPGNQLAETSYEKITEDPISEIGRLYDQLELNGKEEGLEKIAAYVAGLSGYQRNEHRISSGDAEKIRSRWAFSFEEWGYGIEPPDDISVF